MQFLKCYLICALLVLSTVAGSEFEYGKQAKWLDEYEQCSLNKQSPIELISDEAVISYNMADISFVNYNTVFDGAVIIQNNGHTANIVLPKPSSYVASQWATYDKLLPHVSGGPLSSGIFVAESVHFHWGSKDSHGSEHVIDSTRFSMEMHIVHRNTKYQTVEIARDNDDGLAVLSVIYNVDTSVSSFSGLSNVISALQSATAYDQESTIQGFSLVALFGSMDTNNFFTYSGSLTTPPCSQAVTWVVFSEPIAISHDQMSKFHLLVDSHGEVMENNYRSLQPKGARHVTLRKSALKSVWAAFNSV